MATKILVRRGLEADLDSQTLDEGELGFTTDGLDLYIGSDNSSVTEGFIKINQTNRIEYDGTALTSATDTDNLKEVIQNLDAALKTEQDSLDWKLLVEVNSDNVSSLLLNSTLNSAITFDNTNYDYKFVVDAYTNSADVSGSFTVRLEDDSTAGKHSSLRQIAKMESTGSSSVTGGNEGNTGDSIDTGLVLNAGSQGNQTLLQSEFVISKGLAFATDTNINADVHPYIVRGSGSIVGAETTGQASSTVSYSTQSTFSGSYSKGVATGASGNLTSVRIFNLPDAGSVDKVKVRIYKRAR